LGYVQDEGSMVGDRGTLGPAQRIGQNMPAYLLDVLGSEDVDACGAHKAVVKAEAVDSAPPAELTGGRAHFAERIAPAGPTKCRKGIPFPESHPTRSIQHLVTGVEVTHQDRRAALEPLRFHQEPPPELRLPRTISPCVKRHVDRTNDQSFIEAYRRPKAGMWAPRRFDRSDRSAAGDESREAQGGRRLDMVGETSLRECGDKGAHSSASASNDGEDVDPEQPGDFRDFSDAPTSQDVPAHDS